MFPFARWKFVMAIQIRQLRNPHLEVHTPRTPIAEDLKEMALRPLVLHFQMLM